MKFQQILRRAVVGLACLGMVAPQMTIAAERTAVKQAQTNDVALAGSGLLKGQVVNSQGKPVAGAPVVISFAGTVVARTKADANGVYAIKGLRGGVHHVNGTVARLWTNGTAPRTAKHSLLSVQGNVVRGQNYCPPMGGGACPPGAVMGGPVVDGGYCPPAAAAPAAGGGFGMLDLITLATVGTSTAALIYAIDTNNELDDLNNAVASP